MATVASGQLCVSFAGGGGGYVDYTISTTSTKCTVKVTLRDATSDDKTWGAITGSYFGVLVEYNGNTDYYVVSGSTPGSDTFTFDYTRACSEIVIHGYHNNTTNGLVDTYFEHYYYEDTPYTVSWEIENTPPNISFKTIPTLYAGRRATISWTGSDAENDYTVYYSLYRYYKAPGSSSYSFTRVGSTIANSAGTSSLYDDIPSNYEGYLIYYELKATDALDASTTINSKSNPITVLKPNASPVVKFKPLPSLYAGKSATISWETSDADNDTVYTVSLVRYHKAVGDSSFTSTTLSVSDTSKKSYTDIIPKIKGGQVYYVITVRDSNNARASDTSDTGTVLTSCNIAMIVNGTIVEASEIAVVVNGVITAHSGELHTVIGGTIT